MSKWVTIRRKEFNRLRDEARSSGVPEDCIVVAKSYYDELYACQCRLAKIDEDRARLDALLDEKTITDAEKWRLVSSKDNVQEYVADAELGRLVRQMPVGTGLLHHSNGWDLCPCEPGSSSSAHSTPESTLREWLPK